MENLKKYFEDTFGLTLIVHPLQKNELNKLPLFLNETYLWYKAVFAKRTFVLAEMKNENIFSILQIVKHIEIVRTTFELPVIYAFNQLDAYIRKRLIEKKIAFVVPGKQMYMPDFLIDLKEYGNKIKKEQTKLTPIAQLILLFYILNKNDDKQLKDKSFKELAQILQIKPMEISRAVDNLKYLDLIEVTGEKEKYLNFRFERNELWQDAVQHGLLISPVIKKIFVDEMPNGFSMIHSYTSALPEYTDMNPSRQIYIAIEKNVFYQLQKNKTLINENKYEGKYCIEVWKYNPVLLTEYLYNDLKVVDPLSLYLSLKDNTDERIEMALEQIIEKYIW